jgi:hypothetical protein
MLEFSTNGFADGVQAKVDGEVSTVLLVQRFRCALSPQQSPLFKGLNFPLMVLLMLLLGGGGWRGESAELVQKFLHALASQQSPSSRV